MLTDRSGVGICRGMRYCCLFLFLISLARGQDAIVETASPQVIASAVKAVEELGKEVVIGKYSAAVDKMYPQWKERAAERLGGMEKLNAQLANVSRQMLEQGISITDFRPQGEPKAIEVGLGRTITENGGQSVERLRFTKWMVLVPTVTKFRAMLEDDPNPVVIESFGFQVAIADKGQENWTFIDGSSVSINDLRSLFVNLPVDLELPRVEKRQVR